MALPFLTPHSLLPAFEDGTDTWFRNVGILYIDTGEIPKRTYAIFKSRRKLEIYKFDKFLALQCREDVWINRVCRITFHTPLILVFLLWIMVKIKINFSWYFAEVATTYKWSEN